MKEPGYEEKEITIINSEGRLEKEKISVKEYRVSVKDLEGYVVIMFKRKEKYTGVRIDDKDVMIYVGENKNGNRWLTEINNQVKSHRNREEAETYVEKKLMETIKYLGEKANHIYRMAKKNVYEKGRVVKFEYGDLCITKIEMVESTQKERSWNVHVLGKSIWVYDTLEEGIREAKKYFIRYFIQREFIESPWGNYMGGYREIIEQYTQKLIDKEKFEDEKKSLWAVKGGDESQKASMDEFFKEADSRLMVITVEACMCIGKHYLSEIFDKDYPLLRAVSMLNGIKEGFEDEEDKNSMEVFIKNFEKIRGMVGKGERKKKEEKIYA